MRKKMTPALKSLSETQNKTQSTMHNDSRYSPSDFFDRNTKTKSRNSPDQLVRKDNKISINEAPSPEMPRPHGDKKFSKPQALRGHMRIHYKFPNESRNEKASGVHNIRPRRHHKNPKPDESRAEASTTIKTQKEKKSGNTRSSSGKESFQSNIMFMYSLRDRKKNHTEELNDEDWEAAKTLMSLKYDKNWKGKDYLSEKRQKMTNSGAPLMDNKKKKEAMATSPGTVIDKTHQTDHQSQSQSLGNHKSSLQMKIAEGLLSTISSQEELVMARKIDLNEKAESGEDNINTGSGQAAAAATGTKNILDFDLNLPYKE